MKAKKIVAFRRGDTIPDGARFVWATNEFAGMHGFASNLKPFYEPIFYYEVEFTEKK